MALPKNPKLTSPLSGLRQKAGGAMGGFKRGSTAVQPPEAPDAQPLVGGAGVPGVNLVNGGIVDPQAKAGSGMTSPLAPAVAKTTPELAKTSLRNKLATAIPTDATKMQEMLGKTAKPGMTAGQVNGIPQDQWRAMMQQFGIFDH